MVCLRWTQSTSYSTSPSQLSLERQFCVASIKCNRVRDSVPRLLTRLEDLWLLDLRERPEESRYRSIRDHRSKRGSSKRSVTHMTETERLNLPRGRKV